MVDTTVRASVWSITTYGPDADTAPDMAIYQLPPGWKLSGQIERCPTTGRLHHQGMLITKQNRFSAVKNVFPVSHIEVARDPKALATYTKKEESRVESVPTYQGCTVFSLQTKVLLRWDDTRFDEYCSQYANRKTKKELYLPFVDILVSELIEQGDANGIEFVSINPMWRSSWIHFGESIVKRYKNLSS
nr:MAG: replication associated protein [Cressdnaviricota sp.]